MGALWVVAEPGPDGGLARISAEVATLARELGAAAGRDVVGVVVAADPAAAGRGARDATCRVVLADRRPGRRRSRLVGGARPGISPGSPTPTRPMSSSSVPAPTAATWPGPCRR